MSDDDTILQQLVDLAEEQARKVLLVERHRALTPCFVILGQLKTLDVLATPWRNDREKQLVLDIIRAKLRTEHAIAYSSMAEAWMAHYKKEEVPENEEWPELRPNERANRVEVIIIFASTRAKQRLKTLEMVRDRKGKIIELRHHHTEEDAGNLGGSFLSLFD